MRGWTGLVFSVLIMVGGGVVVMRSMVILHRTMVIHVVGMNDNRSVSGWQDNIFQSVRDSCGKNEKELLGSLDREPKARLNQG